jgi:Fe-S-cluster-containing hydrogenase component 2
MQALEIHADKCTGCRQCELACSWVPTGVFQPSRSVIRVHVFDEQASYAPWTRFQCDEAWCMQACPVNAIDVDEARGAKIERAELGIG